MIRLKIDISVELILTESTTEMESGNSYKLSTAKPEKI